MKNSKAILVTAALGLTIGGAHTALAQSDAQLLSDKAMSEMAAGDNWIGTNTQKRATALEPTVENRFNLATGYQRTGRLNTAKGYYQTLAASSDVVPMSNGRGGSFDANMAAADRLLYIDWLQNGANRDGGAASATEAVSNVSATVGGSGEYEVTDEQARALDRQARARR